MDEKIDHAILTFAASSGPKGMAMGTIVDRLVDDGFQESELELRICSLLDSGQLKLIGFVCRTFKINDSAGGSIRRRGYEFMLSSEAPTS